MGKKSSASRPALGTIAKSGEVIDLFTSKRPEWGVSEVASALGMPKSGAHSQLSALTEIGILRRTPGKRYRLGWRLISWTHTLLGDTSFRRQAQDELVTLERHGGIFCSVQLTVLDGAETVKFDQRNGRRAPAILSLPPDRRLPAYSAAAGKLMLAHHPNSEEMIAELELVPLTEHTITDRDELRAALERIRREGVAWDEQETLEQMSCVAAPLRDEAGAVAAAISIAGPALVLSSSRPLFERLVVGAGRRINKRTHDSAGPIRSPFETPGARRELVT